MSAKKIRGYRLSEEAWLEIKRIAELAGSSEAAVIEGWAEQSAKNWVDGPEKKSGRAAKGKPFADSPYAGQIYEDVPDEVENAKPAKKKLPAVPGVVRGTELKAPVKAVGLPGQVIDLATGRIDRAPLLKPGQRK